jgi:hypothetical protein
VARVLVAARLNLSSLTRLVEQWPTSGSIELDFAEQEWVYPSGTVGLSCLVSLARQRGQSVDLVGLDACRNITYWERMSFFRNFGLSGVAASGIPRPARSRFSEVRPIRDINETDEIAAGLVDATSPTPEARQTYSHVVSEALNNVCQHSKAAGFCASQFYENDGSVVRFCIADWGVGLRTSLASHAPNDDLSAILTSLKVGVSGRSRAAQSADPAHMRNRGVGLSAIERLVVSNGGELVIWSGSALYSQDANGAESRQVTNWQGTLLTAKMPRNVIRASFRDVMEQLIAELGCIEHARTKARYSRST